MMTLLRHLDRQSFRPILAVANLTGAAYLADLPADVAVLDMACKRVRHAMPRFLKLIWRLRPDLVFSTLGHMNLALAAVIPVMPRRTAFVGREASVVSEILNEERYPWLWRSAYRALYPRFDAVVCQSKQMKADLVDSYGLDSEKLTIINNPVDVERIFASLPAITAQRDDRSGRPLRLVAVGRLSREKGFDLLIEATSLLSDLDVMLTIVGDGPLLQELRQRAATLGLEQRVSFAGFQSNPYPLLADADAFVLSSLYEGFPNVVLEALACGVGVIATPVSDIADVLHGATGCVVANAATADDLAAAIRAWAARPGSSVDSSVLDRFRVGEVVGKYETLFHQVCDKRAGGIS